MTTSAFGVELGKGLRFGRTARKTAEAAVHLDFKPIKPGVKPVGPGSLRRRMDPSAHETQLAADRRGEVGKSAFGVAGAHVPTAVGRLKPVPPATAATIPPAKRLNSAIAATTGSTS